MASLEDKSLFEDVFRLENDTPAEAITPDGGISYANIQAQILANRTRYLMNYISSLKVSMISGVKYASDPEEGISITKEGEIFGVTHGVGSSPALTLYWNISGEAVIAAEMSGQSDIDEIKLLINSNDVGSDIYLAVTDDNGLIGEHFHCKSSDGSFGSQENRVSDSGLETKKIKLFHDEGGSFPVMVVDQHGLCFIPGIGSSDGGSDSSVSNEVIVGSIKSESGLVELWNFANKDFLGIGKLSSTALAITGNPVKWPNSITMKPGSSWLTLPYTESALFTIKVVFQLPYIAMADTATARGVVYGFDNGTAMGMRIHIARSASGVYQLYVFKPEVGFPFAGISLPPEFTAGDWLCLHHVVSRANAGNNYQVLFLGGRYHSMVEPDTTVFTNTNTPLKIGATSAPYSGSVNYSYCELHVAEVAYYNTAITENALRNSFYSTKNRMSNLGIILKGF